MNTKITVIIPIYNTRQYLDDCLNSVRKQTFTDIEIICIDDCSQDDSYLIVNKHIACDSRIRLIRHKKNMGLGGARNTGIALAKSEYIASVDSDDSMKETMLEKLWIAANNSKDIVCCGYDELNENGKVLHSRNLKKIDIVKSGNIDIFNIFNPSFCNKLWRRSLFVDNNIFFPESSFFEDTATTPRLLTRAKTIKIIDQSYYNYFQRDDSITSTFSEKHQQDLFSAYDMVLEFLVKDNLLNYYKEAFAEYIESGVRFHAQGIASSSMSKNKKDKYLEVLKIKKEVFLENKLLYFKKNIRELSFIQKQGSKLFEVIFGFLISPTHLKKLRYNPEFFF